MAININSNGTWQMEYSESPDSSRKPHLNAHHFPRRQPPQNNFRCKVHLIGSQKLLNELLCGFLSSKGGFIATHSSPEEVKTKLAEGDVLDVDVIMLDNYSPEILKMFYEGRKGWLASLQGIPSIIFNFYLEKYLKKWIAWGVRGVLREQETLHNLTKAISSVSQSQIWFPRQAMSQCLEDNWDRQLDPRAPRHCLTQREQEVLTLIARGASNAEAAEKLFISPYTVRVHMQNIYRKINVPNRVSAALWAKENLL